MNKDACQTAWTYEKLATKDCGANAYLSKDGECYCNSKLIFNKNTKKCEQKAVEIKKDLQTKRIAYYEYSGSSIIKITEVNKDYKTIKNIDNPENAFARGDNFVVSWNNSKDLFNVQCPANLRITSCEIEDYKFQDYVYTDPSALIEKDDSNFCFMNGKFLKYGKLRLECDKE